MYDINKPQTPKKPFNITEEATSLFISNIPFTYLSVMLKDFGLIGPEGIIILFLICFFSIRRIRHVHNLKASRKTVLYAIGWNVLLIGILPILLLVISA